MRERLATRLAELRVDVPPEIVQGCVAYFSLLSRWNQRMNLTALPLADPVSDASLDKLLIEPLVAADLVPKNCSSWIDLGSGGGSPAIPLRLTHRHGFAR